MDIKHKTCDIRTWKQHLFLNIPSTNTDTLVHRFTNASKPTAYKSFWLLSQPLPCLFQPLRHQRSVCHPDVNHFTWQNTSHRKQETFLYEYPLHWLVKLTSEHAHACLLPRLSWSWTMLLPSDTHKKPNKSTMAVLLPSVIYLLSLHHKKIFIQARSSLNKKEPTQSARCLAWTLPLTMS
jgi:hypothetical protein